MTAIEQPAWAALIEEQRKEMRPRLSARKAAERAGLSEGRWRQIVKGYQSTSGGRIPVVGPAETVARMAKVVGLSPDELAKAGRPDAANEIRKVEAEHPDWVEQSLDIGSMWAELSAYMQASDEEWTGYPPTNALALWSTEQLLEVLAGRVKDLLKSDQRMTQRLIVRGEAIDTLRRELGLEPLYSHLSESGFNTPEAVKRAGGLVEGLSEAPDRTTHLVAADEQESSISGEQEQPETP